MKLTKVAISLLIPMLVLPLFGRGFQLEPAHARPTAVVTLNWVLCLTMTASEDWDADTDVDDADSTAALSNCQALTGPAAFPALLRVLDADVDNPQPEDLAAVDVDGGQFHQLDGAGYVIAFVNSDQPVAFFADTGVFDLTGSSAVSCGPPPLPSPDYDFTEEDCDADGVRGDGVVLVRYSANGADRGPGVFRVRQGMIEVEEPYTIVGEPRNITVSPYKTTVQAGATECELFEDTPTFLAALGAPERTPLVAKVMDQDGTEVTAALVAFEIEDSDGATTALPLVPTLSSPLGVGAPNVLCGLEPGVVTLKASIRKAPDPASPSLDLNATERSTRVEITVQGPPKDMVLSASPGSLVCDGTATATVSATLTDGEGNPAVDGNVVVFESKTLGVVSPKEAKSAGGVASTTLTPLSDIARGVTVKASLMLPELVDDETVMVPVIEKSIIVACAEAAPAAPPAPAPPAPAPVIQPPPTGDGGYLP